MMKRWQIILGILLIFFGLFSLLDVIIVDINLSRFFWPLVLIGLGVLVIYRTQAVRSDVELRVPVIGDIRQSGRWEVSDQEIWWFVGSNHLDFTDAIFSKRGITIKIISFVTDVKIIIPRDVGLYLSSTAFLSDYDGFNRKEERFVSTLEDQTSNYLNAEKRVNIQILGFVTDVKVRGSTL